MALPSRKCPCRHPRPSETSRAVKPEAVTQDPSSRKGDKSPLAKPAFRAWETPSPISDRFDRFVRKALLVGAGRPAAQVSGNRSCPPFGKRPLLARPGSWGRDGRLLPLSQEKKIELLERLLAPPLCAALGLLRSACAFPRAGQVLKPLLSWLLPRKDAFSCQKVFLVIKKLLAFQSQEYWILWPRPGRGQALLGESRPPGHHTWALDPAVLPETKAVSSAPSSGVAAPALTHCSDMWQPGQLRPGQGHGLSCHFSLCVNYWDRSRFLAQLLLSVLINLGFSKTQLHPRRRAWPSAASGWTCAAPPVRLSPKGSPLDRSGVPTWCCW